MFLLILGIHLSLCAVLVALVLMQQGKGADMGATLGSGSSNTMFGAAGATSVVSKVTTGTAVAFMVTSILLARLYLNIPTIPGAPANPLKGSVLEGSAAVDPQAAEKTPAAPAPAAAPLTEKK